MMLVTLCQFFTRPRSNCAKQLLVATIFICASAVLLHAELVGDDRWGYAFDLPEGMYVTDSAENGSLQLRCAVAPVDMVIFPYPYNHGTDVRNILDSMLKQLNASSNQANTDWRGMQCVISQISFTPPDKTLRSGWALAVELAEEKGFLAVACFAPEKSALQCENIIISILDSLSIDRGSWFEAGPMTAFAWQPDGTKQVTVHAGKKDIRLTTGKIDADANQYVIDREFDVLKLYMESPLWKEAWQRYYRIIFRDAFARLETAAFTLYDTLALDAENAPDELELAQIVLDWIQTIPEQRDPQGSDFTSLPALLSGAGGDCDSKALLYLILLHHMNYDTVLFISREYSHALAGVAKKERGNNTTSQNGAQMEVNGVPYLVAETTAKVPIGRIAQNHADPEKWFSVDFYK